ncbi:MAG TPA: phosphoglycerate dehydrogenase [Actinotalea caeni]|uniref:phosphoglycerate dehydrogenase n=1 Tax=Actinotalea caeni TaxID=1348467 RepID=UPI0012E1C36A|nr:phosphoglycerate dehydrogenase [Actinotalea caeni]HLV54987.1 phosphoglycerate dehydrogenase [Actinotalea caeni]
MSDLKILVPTVIPIDLEVPAGVVRVDYDVEQPVPEEHRDAEVVVVWLNPGERLAALPSELPRLRWVQGLMAGTDAVHAAGFGPDVVITAGVGLHDQPVAEHTLAMILAAARRLDETVVAQREHRWLDGHTGNQIRNRTGFTTLAGSRVTIWGFGGIGTTLAGYLTALGAEVVGVARSAGERDGYRVVTPDDLPEELPRTDVLVDILPGTQELDGAIGAEVFAALPRHAWFVNVGRGVTVDEVALEAALRSGEIAGAALDVFREEPLPADSPLWDAPNLIITPHSAGGRPQQPGRLIAENLRRYLAGEELLGVSTP